jgi:hypothetical protein
MVALKDMVRRTSNALSEPEHEFPTKSISAAGIVLVVIAALGVYWLLPEIRRYLRIERM